MPELSTAPESSDVAVVATDRDVPRIQLDERTTTAVSIAFALVLGVVLAAGGQTSTTTFRAGESGLPGRAAALYPNEVAARDACGPQRVAFADAKARVVYGRANRAFGVWDDLQPPDRGYGCLDDLRATGLRFAP